MIAGGPRAFLFNFHFDAVGTNYFTASLPQSPLQNFWSLSVEEQFYVIYPTIFLSVASPQRPNRPANQADHCPWHHDRGVILVVSRRDHVQSFLGILFPLHPGMGIGPRRTQPAVNTHRLKALPRPTAALLSWIGTAEYSLQHSRLAPILPIRVLWWGSRLSVPVCSLLPERQLPGSAGVTPPLTAISVARPTVVLVVSVALADSDHRRGASG